MTHNEIENELSKYFSISFVAKTIKDDWECNQWLITFKGKLPNTFYYTGLGIKTIPTILDVVMSLFLDSYAARMSFNDWCDDYGYDNDSLQAFNCYQECCKSDIYIRALPTNIQKALEELSNEW